MSNYPVDGPFRIGVTALPGGAAIDVSHFLHHLILGLAQAADEDGPALIEELAEIHAMAMSPGGPDSPAVHERDAAVERVLAGLTDDGRIPVYGAQVELFAAALLRTVRPRLLPEQQDRRAS
ncbi:hypothetical protein LG634_24900 [Streptomyces bambusae]|uniref:hypothetical protein n=1 Tax=Streptomyces bambusae TaxID=1550616 RepID=UPI001CFF15A2|nr:hypothetical protein [Streptomyces bambusae]MCB5168053.1 hypothetical protein [Streptomyces bambusae]